MAVRSRRFGRRSPARRKTAAMREHDRSNRSRRRATRVAAARSIRRCAFCRARERDAMFEIYSFCRAVDDIADDRPARATHAARTAASAGAPTSTRSMPAAPPAHARSRASRCSEFGLRREDFLAVIDGMEMDVVADIRAPDRATLDLYCDRVASAVGRLSVRVFGMADAERHRARASSRPRAAAHQHPARSRRGCRRSGGSICRARRLRRRRHHRRTDPATVLAQSECSASAASTLIGARARAISSQADAIMARQPRRAVRAPRIMGEAYRVDPRPACRARLVRRRASRCAIEPRLLLSCDLCATRSSDERERSMSSAPGSPALSAAVRLAQARQRRHRARGHGVRPAGAAAPITMPRST